jgi:alpha-galactosidase
MRALTITTAAFLAATQLWGAISVTPDERAEARAWVAAKVLGQQATIPGPGLLVLANHDPVHRNARGGKPLRIVDKEYTRGLYCHAVSAVVVKLPGPGKTLSAIAGVDSNDQTRPGRGSVVFSLRASGKEAFRSDVMREGMAGVPVQVDLGGAREFTLEIGDAGDGISCDQADWAEARVVLEDGATVWLGDMPMLDRPPGAMYTADPFFSFVYDGKPSAELLAGWQRRHTERKLDEQRTEHVLTWTDAKTGLVVRCVMIEYQDFPTVEWTLHFKNTGAADTPIVEKILALDTAFQRGEGGEFLLRHNIGSICSASDFGPLQTPLGPGATKRISAAGGRPTNSDMCYFNLEWPGEGRILAIGWPGQWAADFTRDGTIGLGLRAGQELTHFKLLPGEEVRTPLIVLQFSKGSDWIRAQNLWRRWMMAHSMPKPRGQLPQPAFRASSSRAYEEMIGANEENQIMHIDRYVEEKLGLDTWWMDAGWYPQEHGWPQVGTWEVDPKRFPRGFKPISEHAHARGIKILVWFEPERVAAGTWLSQNHPEWILGGAAGGLLNLGNPEAQKWLTDHIDKLLTDQGIDTYRQDFNMDPLDYWRRNDAPDRQGITEIRHVEGLLAFWDELRRRHPDMLIDTCASGGRRVDVETLRRAVPLWRSDYAFEPVGHQCQTYGLSMWVPYHGTGTVAYSGAPYYGGGATPVQPYAFWSNAAPSLGSGIDLRVKEIDYAALRKLLAEWRETCKYYYGDFYPLTPYTLDATAWMAWQFDHPDLGEGMVQAFRRAESFYESARFRLRGLSPDVKYQVTNLDEPAPVVLTGRELMETGLLVALKDQASAAVIVYKATK